MRQNRGQSNKGCLLIVALAALSVCSCTRETVTFPGFPPLRVSTPVPMSPLVVDEILADWRGRLLTEASRITTRGRRSCEQYQAEVEWLLPTSPYSKRQLTNALRAREISQSRFTSFVRDEPESVRQGMEKLYISLEAKWPELYAARPTGCEPTCPWRPHPRTGPAPN